MNHLTILDVGALCARQQAVDLDLFELLGSWVTATAPGSEQRRWARLAHQHAWHAELWAERAPTIPAVDHAAAVDAHRGALTEPRPLDRERWYSETMHALSIELDAASDALDPELDPSTQRVIDLVLNDVRAATPTP